MVSIYILRDPRTGSVRYVGQTVAPTTTTIPRL